MLSCTQGIDHIVAKDCTRQRFSFDSRHFLSFAGGKKTVKNPIEQGSVQQNVIHSR
ncbi:hypothetical protein BN2476_960059 [Paraburkholderia piptadeniae]|uniref:Uncharacterized protein n=1 Tax=Paraburkholderia piptadeniae TaxID=1701573 RepID=A0A1N7SUB3_9BURK|nr:hypothetical protein BN2476_960059 [Paraburkholderia piptadeniae]